jgi:hypothetical protein
MKSIKVEFPSRIEYQNEKGQRHRTDGPAVEYKDGVKQWWVNGQCHRENGPAFEYPSGAKFWFLNGNPYTEQEWKQEVAKIKLKRILDL